MNVHALEDSLETLQSVVFKFQECVLMEQFVIETLRASMSEEIDSGMRRRHKSP
jgi:hypothetical protein